MIERGAAADIPSWLEIVREVEPLFGPMPSFDATLERSIERGGAWCVREDNVIVGGCSSARLIGARSTGLPFAPQRAA